MIHIKPPIIWNTKKQGGWDAYKTATTEFGNLVIDQTKSTTEISSDIERKLNKKKFESFGKVKLRSKKEDKELKRLYEVKCSKVQNKLDIEDVDKDICEKLIEMRREDVEKELQEIMLIKKSKGKSAAVFNTLKKIFGIKKVSKEQVLMIHPKGSFLN